MFNKRRNPNQDNIKSIRKTDRDMDKGRHQCTKCEQNFGTKLLLAIHMAAHEGE